MTTKQTDLDAEFQKLSEELRAAYSQILTDLNECKITPGEAKARRLQLRPREQEQKQRLAEAKKAARGHAK